MMMNFSYWEAKSYLGQFDLIVVGGGIVGLSTAISFRESHPAAKILVTEKGILPSGASTKNAGFACFGSAGEILDDLGHNDPTIVFDTIALRFKGLERLRKRLGDAALAYESTGGYEIFPTALEFETVLCQMPALNRELFALVGNTCFEKVSDSSFGFGPHAGIIKNNFEGQLDTGKLMQELTRLAYLQNIQILTGVLVKHVQSDQHSVRLSTSFGDLRASCCVVATNAFASQLLDLKDVVPGRAQVLVTKPIKNLKIKGSFHVDRGYYYFRNIDQRILLGGGRNLNPLREQTFENGLTSDIQTSLETLLRDLILPDQAFEIDRRWSGIMGLGSEKMPILKEVQNRVIAAVRMGGMGVAIGTIVGENAAKMASQY